MNRRMALRKKKNIASNGHSFQTTRFYQLVKCAVCGELMFSTSGYQCLRTCRVRPAPLSITALNS